MASLVHRIGEQLIGLPIRTISVESEIVQFYLLAFVLFSADLL